MTGRGHPITMRSGGLWYPSRPSPADVRAEDFPALARVQRWGCQTITPYSVAEHCARVAEHLAARGADGRLVLMGLTHDLHEIYPPGDIAGPILHDPDSPFAPALREMELRARDALRAALRLPLDFGTEVHHADVVLLETERRDLMPPSEVRKAKADPLPDHIVPWTEAEAWEQWIGWHKRLGGVLP